MPELDEFKLFRNKHPEAQEWLRRILAFAGDNHNTKLLPCRDQPGAQPTFMVMEHKYFTFSGINLRVPSITMTFYQEPHRYPGILTAEQIAAVEFRHSGQNLSKAKVTDAQHVGFVCLLVDHTWKLKRLNRVRWHDLPSGEAEWEGRITFRDHQNVERTFRDYCRASSADAAKASFSADHAALKVIQIEVRRLPPVAP